MTTNVAPFYSTTMVYRAYHAALIVLLTGITDWLITELQPDKNALFWLAGTFGAFAIRLTPLARMGWKRSVSGWLLGTLFAFFIAPSAVDWVWLVRILSKPLSIWFVVGLFGDSVILVLSWARGKATENPEAAFDAGLSISKKIYDTFGSGEGIGVFIKSIFNGFNKPK